MIDVLSKTLKRSGIARAEQLDAAITSAAEKYHAHVDQIPEVSDEEHALAALGEIDRAPISDVDVAAHESQRQALLKAWTGLVEMRVKIEPQAIVERLAAKDREISEFNARCTEQSKGHEQAIQQFNQLPPDQVGAALRERMDQINQVAESNRQERNALQLERNRLANADLSAKRGVSSEHWDYFFDRLSVAHDRRLPLLEGMADPVLRAHYIGAPIPSTSTLTYSESALVLPK